MKFGNTNPVISTVGSNGKGFRAVRNRSNVDARLTSSGVKTAAKPSAPVIALSVTDINWRLVRTDDRIFSLLASVALGDGFDVAKLEKEQLLFSALSVFEVGSIKYILNELSEHYPNVPVGKTDSTDKDDLVSAAVNFLMFAAIAQKGGTSQAPYTSNCEHFW